MKKDISDEAKAMLEEMTELMSLTLPKNNECNTPISRIDRAEWADLMIELLFQITNIIFIEEGFTVAHDLKDIGEVAGISSERIRQNEFDAIKKIFRNNSEEELEDFRLSIQEFFDSQHDKITDFQNPVDSDGKVRETRA